MASASLVFCSCWYATYVRRPKWELLDNLLPWARVRERQACSTPRAVLIEIGDKKRIIVVVSWNISKFNSFLVNWSLRVKAVVIQAPAQNTCARNVVCFDLNKSQVLLFNLYELTFNRSHKGAPLASTSLMCLSFFRMLSCLQTGYLFVHCTSS